MWQISDYLTKKKLTGALWSKQRKGIVPAVRNESWIAAVYDSAVSWFTAVFTSTHSGEFLDYCEYLSKFDVKFEYILDGISGAQEDLLISIVQRILRGYNPKLK
jgi:hypothetical protein